MDQVTEILSGNIVQDKTEKDNLRRLTEQEIDHPTNAGQVWSKGTYCKTKVSDTSIFGAASRTETKREEGFAFS